MDRVSNNQGEPQVLRAACIHGRYEGHTNAVTPTWCDGGNEVTDSDILTMAADIIETNDAVGAVFHAARHRSMLAQWQDRSHQ